MKAGFVEPNDRRHMLDLARDLLSNSADPIDGLSALGRAVGGAQEIPPLDFPAIIALWDDLDAVPKQAQRASWQPLAYEEARSRGREIIDGHSATLGAELRHLVALLESLDE